MNGTSFGIIASTLVVVVLAFSLKAATAGEDARVFVKLPPMMRDHMLMNMRDHLVALDEILGELAKGNVDEAGKIAEARLGMTSMTLHGAEHIGKFMPKEMGAIGTAMHKAASRFVLAAQDAELDPSKESQHKVYGALQDVTQACNACHQGYRVR